MKRSHATKSSASLAGWIFADLSLLLALLFASTTSDMHEGPSSSTSSTTTVVPCPQTSPSSECPQPGVRPDPVVFVIESASGMRPSTFRDELSAVVAARTDLPPNTKFGVILIYGGSAGSSDSRIGDTFARKIQTWLEQWDRVTNTTYYQPGHDQSVNQGSVRLKLFPILASNG